MARCVDQEESGGSDWPPRSSHASLRNDGVCREDVRHMGSVVWRKVDGEVCDNYIIMSG